MKGGKVSYSSEDMLRFLKYNLSELKLEDVTVTGVIYVYRDNKYGPVLRTVKFSPYLLSSVCAFSRNYLNEVEVDLAVGEVMRNSIRVLKGSQEIGYINLEGVFHFTQAPCLYQSVAWGLATGQGAIAHLSHDNVKNIATALTDWARRARRYAPDSSALAHRKEYFLLLAREFINRQNYRDDSGRDLPSMFWEVAEKRIISA